MTDTNDIKTKSEEKEKAQSGDHRLKVIIVGGSISGLTLAHCLHANDIDYVVLEAYGEITPQVGSSIVISPNGARILDQLGIADEIYARVKPIEKIKTWTSDGRLISEHDGMLVAAKRTGYAFAFLQRYELLTMLYDHLPNKSKVHTSKRVVETIHNETEVVVICKDGSRYTGDVVVGADGVHSTVRSHMRDYIDSTQPGATTDDRHGLSAEYNCIFGISNPVNGEAFPGESHRTYDEGRTAMCFVDEGGIVFWFLLHKLDKQYFGEDIPKYTKLQTESNAKEFFDMAMASDVTYEKVWKERIVANMACVEESQNEYWTAGRYVCIGDAVHKTTPNLGAGGNAAIESAAALANSLSKLKGRRRTLDDITKMLMEFYAKRHPRANFVCDLSDQLTRIEAFESLTKKFIALHVLPRTLELTVDVQTDIILGGELLACLPAPIKSLTATMPYNSDQGFGKHESKFVRALYGIPILAFFFIARWTFSPALNAVPRIEDGILRPFMGLEDGLVVPLQLKYLGWKLIDEFIALYAAVFTSGIGGYDPISRMQMIAFLADIVPVHVVFLVEGVRRGNFMTVAYLLPTLIGVLYQVCGIALLGPIYFFLHWVQSPLENYAAADNRLTRISAAKTIIPTILLTYVIPGVAMFTIDGIKSRQWINGLIWQPFPIYSAILQYALGKLVKDTTPHDRIHNPEADMVYLRKAYAFAGILAASAHLYVFLASPVSLTRVFFDNLGNPSAVESFMGACAKVLRYDYLCVFGAASVWILLSFYDLKKAGRLEAGWWKILATFFGLILTFGPGTMIAFMWWWREEVLASRRRLVVVSTIEKQSDK